MSNLRAGRLSGLHFRRQQIIDGFIVDFFCFEAGLIIEVDGSIHRDRTQEDADRTEAFGRRKLQVVRFSNQQVFDNLSTVLIEVEALALARIAEMTRTG